LVAANLIPSKFAEIITKSGLTGVTIASVGLTTATANQAIPKPALAVTDPPVTADLNSISVTLKLLNTDGYLYASAGADSASLPVFADLINGLNGAPSASTFAEMNKDYPLSLGGLKEGTSYQLFFAGAGLDLSAGGDKTSVYRKNVTTKTTVVEVSGTFLQVSFALLALVLALFTLV